VLVISVIVVIAVLGDIIITVFFILIVAARMYVLIAFISGQSMLTTHARTHSHIHVRTSVRMHARTYTCASTNVCTHAPRCAGTSVRTYVCTYACMFVLTSAADKGGLPKRSAGWGDSVMVSGRRYCACVGNRGALIGAPSAFTLLDFLFPNISILFTAFPCF
jgi:hypothetical protein